MVVAGLSAVIAGVVVTRRMKKVEAEVPSRFSEYLKASLLIEERPVMNGSRLDDGSYVVTNLPSLQ